MALTQRLSGPADFYTALLRLALRPVLHLDENSPQACGEMK